MTDVVLETDFADPLSRGKVRDTYRLGNVLLMVATDRISAFDVVLPSGIPDKGRVLTQLSAFWFERTAGIVPNHFLEVVEDPEHPSAYCGDGFCPIYPASIVGRSMIVKPAEPIALECVVRGYLAGSGWSEYRERGTLNGEILPAGLVEAAALPEPRFTPTTKAVSGHDEPLSRQAAGDLVGQELVAQLEDLSLRLYAAGHEHAAERGIILADTKFEFGFIDGELCLIDELLTPDSSRFWPADVYRPGAVPPSYDKQPVRDWLAASDWDRAGPPPPLPDHVVAATSERYRTAFRILTDRELI